MRLFVRPLPDYFVQKLGFMIVRSLVFAKWLVAFRSNRPIRCLLACF